MLAENGGEMLFAELLEAAHAGVSSVQTLARRRLLEVFVRDVRRDPLAGATLPSTDDFRLTSEQAVGARRDQRGAEQRARTRPSSCTA